MSVTYNDYPTQSVRAQLVERRTYLRPLDKHGKTFETPEQSWLRVIDHQRWLWERAQHGQPLDKEQEDELDELYWLFINRKVTVSGRTRWLGGTAIAQTREASQFNCSFLRVRTVHDIVDTIWLLLQGCGVGFLPEVGVLNGFAQAIDDVVIHRSEKVITYDDEGNPISDPALKGAPNNYETYNAATQEWYIRLGDSAEAWAKFFGKIMAMKKPVKKIEIDFREVRPAGYRLSGYGWISSGDEQIAEAVIGIIEIMNKGAGRLLTSEEIHEIENYLGTILSSRRSAEIGLYMFGGPEWRNIATMKKDYYFHHALEDASVYANATDDQSIGVMKEGTSECAWGDAVNGRIPFQRGWVDEKLVKKKNDHKSMSNNSLLFFHKPERPELVEIFDLMMAAGGSDPGFINAVEALRRAPYFKGVNPCGEILLGDQSFCNLVETIVCRFNGDEAALHRAHYLVARANYRQTCVNLDDGVLQRSWHELNEFLRLCGVGVTGVIGWEGCDDKMMQSRLRAAAQNGANGMADELALPRPQLVTTVKPSGTQSKTAGLVGDEVGEGVHKPLGRYIFNNIMFPKDDPACRALDTAGYHSIPHPKDAQARIYRFPVEYNNIKFDTVVKTVKGKEVEVEVNLETAIDQLERYKMWMENYVDHNCSITVSYSPDEVPAIIDWLMKNWESYVGVSFLYRNDPTKTAEDLGHPYLPQEVVDKDTFHDYADYLMPVDLNGTDIEGLLDTGECATGACPVR